MSRTTRVRTQRHTSLVLAFWSCFTCLLSSAASDDIILRATNYDSVNDNDEDDDKQDKACKHRQSHPLAPLPNMDSDSAMLALDPLLRQSAKHTRDIFASCPDESLKQDEKRYAIRVLFFDADTAQYTATPRRQNGRRVQTLPRIAPCTPRATGPRTPVLAKTHHRRSYVVRVHPVAPLTHPQHRPTPRA